MAVAIGNEALVMGSSVSLSLLVITGQAAQLICLGCKITMHIIHVTINKLPSMLSYN